MAKERIRDWTTIYIHPEHKKKVKEIAQEMGREDSRQLHWMLEKVLYNRKYY